MKNGYESHYMKITRGGSMVGVACFNVDHTHLADFRGYLRHLTVLNIDDFSPALQACLSFIWTNTVADNIRVDLVHIADGPEPDA